jgi:hypothetical protein
VCLFILMVLCKTFRMFLRTYAFRWTKEA